MSYLKISNNLAIDDKELSIFQSLINEKGWRDILKENTLKYGITQNQLIDTDFESFRVSSTGGGYISINTGKAISLDSITGEVKVITIDKELSLQLPDDSNWYFLKIKHKYTSLEKGDVSIDAGGNLVGDGTCEFTKTLRAGGPLSSIVKFYQQTESGSSLNPLKYRVERIIDDNHAILSGIFQVESNIRYTIYGTFTPGYIPQAGEFNPFQYDSCIPFLIDEGLLLDTGSIGLIDDEEFFIARVSRTGTNVQVQDLRSSIWQTKAELRTDFVDVVTNPLIGIESISFDDPNTAQDKNLLQIGWGFRANTWAISTNDRTLTISGSDPLNTGGVFRSTADFIDGSFDFWKVYISDERRYCRVNSSYKDGSSIKLELDSLLIEDFYYPTYNNVQTYNSQDKVSINTSSYYCLINGIEGGLDFIDSSWKGAYNPITAYNVDDRILFSGIYYKCLIGNTGQDPLLQSTYWVAIWRDYTQTISVVPDVEEIGVEILVGENVSNDVVNSVVNEEYWYPINKGYAKIPILAINDATITDPIYTIRYRYKNNHSYSPQLPIQSDSLVGYTNENLILTPYIADFYKPFIKAIKSAGALSNFRDRVDTGELLGVNDYTLSNSTPYLNLKVGSDKTNQIITGGELTLTGDIVINLSSFLIDGITRPRDGVKFYIQCKQSVLLNSQNILFKYGAESSPGVGGTVIHTVTSGEIQRFKDTETGVLYTFTYSSDSLSWIIQIDYLPSKVSDYFYAHNIFLDYNMDSNLWNTSSRPFSLFGYNSGTYIENNYPIPTANVTINSGATTQLHTDTVNNGALNRELKITLPTDGVYRRYEIKTSVRADCQLSGGGGFGITGSISIGKTTLIDGDVMSLYDTQSQSIALSVSTGDTHIYAFEVKPTTTIIHDGLSDKTVRIHINTLGVGTFTYAGLNHASMEIIGTPIL